MVSTCGLSLRMLKVLAVGFSRNLSPLCVKGMQQKLRMVLPSGELLAAPVEAIHPRVKLNFVAISFMNFARNDFPVPRPP